MKGKWHTMEISLQELGSLLTAGTQPPSPAPGSDSGRWPIGERVLIRTHTSGVSVGVLESVTETVAGYEFRLSDGLRIWSWNGGALACSELATRGPDSCKTERHGAGVTIIDRAAELHLVTAEAWERITQ